MKNNRRETFISITLAYGILGPLLGGALLEFGAYVLRVLGIMGRDYGPSVGDFVLFSPLLGLIPALSAGIYVARSACNQQLFYVGGYYSLTVITSLINGILVLFFAPLVAVAGVFSSFVLLKLIRFRLHNTPFRIIDAPTESSEAK